MVIRPILTAIVSILITVSVYERWIIPQRSCRIDVSHIISEDAFVMLRAKYVDQPDVLMLLEDAKAGYLMGKRKEDIEGLKLMSIRGDNKEKTSYLLAPVFEEYQPYLLVNLDKKHGVVTRVDIAFAEY